MIRVKLDERWTTHLLQFPEQGMGFQRVDITFANGQCLSNWFVYNAQFAYIHPDLADVEITNITLH